VGNKHVVLKNSNWEARVKKKPYVLGLKNGNQTCKVHAELKQCKTMEVDVANFLNEIVKVLKLMQ
jgi:hypothetical protein